MLIVGEACRRDESEAGRMAVPPSEVLECEREISICLFHLRDEARAAEARVLLLQSLHGAHTWQSGGLTPASRERLGKLLEHEYFDKARPRGASC
eukprot:1283717-Prymnesium_polylepis.2